MNNLFSRQFAMLLRVRAFGSRHASLFPPASVAGQLFAVIEAAIPELSKNAGMNAAGAGLGREHVTARSAARESLRQCMDAISRTARAIGRSDASIGAKFNLPRSTSDQETIGTARGFLQNAEAMKGVFLAHEMAPDFIVELQTAIERFEVSISNHTDTKSLKVANTASIEKAIDDAMEAVKRLSGIVPNKVRKDYAILKEWESARRVASARVPKPSEPETPPAPAA